MWKCLPSNLQMTRRSDRGLFCRLADALASSHSKVCRNLQIVRNKEQPCYLHAS